METLFLHALLLALETAKLEFTTACCALNFDLFKAPQIQAIFSRASKIHSKYRAARHVEHDK